MTSTQPQHPIRVVALRTGLTADLIRAWEKRYQVVTPGRTDTARRLYSDSDVERLRLLRQATDLGRRISDIAELDTLDLVELIKKDRDEASVPVRLNPNESADLAVIRHQIMDAVRAHDPQAVDALLHKASLENTVPVLMEEVIAPVLHQIGESTRDGSLRIAQEHVATAQIRTFLGHFVLLAPNIKKPPNRYYHPERQLHELGALMVSVTCASEGWSPIYLGPNTPADEIAAAVIGSGHWPADCRLPTLLTILVCRASYGVCAVSCPRASHCSLEAPRFALTRLCSRNWMFLTFHRCMTYAVIWKDSGQRKKATKHARKPAQRPDSSRSIPSRNTRQ